MLVVNLIVIAFFVLMGILFARGKGMSLIAGYNTLSPREKEKYDKEKLSRAMARMMFHTKALYWVGMVLFLVVIIGGVIYMNTGNRLKK